MEELQSIFEMLFPDHVRQLQPLYLKMKDTHDEKVMISGYVLHFLKWQCGSKFLSALSGIEPFVTVVGKPFLSSFL